MTDLMRDMDTLHQEIMAVAAGQRLSFQPQLSQLVDAADAAGVEVSVPVRTLCEELESEAIEAQFDNMPV